MKFVGLAIFLPSMLIWAGCAQDLESRRFQSNLIRGAEPSEVFDSAQVILRREFGPLVADRDAWRIATLPAEYQTSSDSGTARDLYRGRSTMRRTAHFSVNRHAEGAVVRLRIDIERQDTERREAFHPEAQRMSDAPSQTPIERDAATSAQQNAIWTFVRRDVRLERELLAELQERFAPPPEELEPQPPAQPPTVNSQP